MSGFAPSAWLQAEEAGGHYIVRCGDRISMGWSLDSVDVSFQCEVSRLFKLLKENEEMREAVREYLLARQRIPA